MSFDMPQDQPIDRQEYEAWEAKQSRVLTCVYCGQEYPQGTPASGSEILTEHIKICERHPMRKLSEQNAVMRKALVGLVGAESREELEQMEIAIRMMPVPDIDKMNTINAIQALIQTLS